MLTDTQKSVWETYGDKFKSITVTSFLNTLSFTYRNSYLATLIHFVGEGDHNLPQRNALLQLDDAVNVEHSNKLLSVIIPSLLIELQDRDLITKVELLDGEYYVYTTKIDDDPIMFPANQVVPTLVLYAVFDYYRCLAVEIAEGRLGLIKRDSAIWRFKSVLPVLDPHYYGLLSEENLGESKLQAVLSTIALKESSSFNEVHKLVSLIKQGTLGSSYGERHFDEYAFFQSTLRFLYRSKGYKLVKQDMVKLCQIINRYHKYINNIDKKWLTLFTIMIALDDTKLSNYVDTAEVTPLLKTGLSSFDEIADENVALDISEVFISALFEGVRSALCASLRFLTYNEKSALLDGSAFLSQTTLAWLYNEARAQKDILTDAESRLKPIYSSLLDLEGSEGDSALSAYADLVDKLDDLSRSIQEVTELVEGLL